MTEPVRPPIAWRPLAALCAAFVALLIAVSGGYGYHRDELYFIAIGGHPAFGYVDQPPLVPLLAHAIDAASGHSLLWLRVSPAIAGALVVLVTGLLAREFGGGRAVQLLAAAAMAVSGFTLGTSHLMSTTTFDLLGWTVLSWLVVRALRTGATAEEAFARLQEISQTEHTKLVEVAQRLVDEAVRRARARHSGP